MRKSVNQVISWSLAFVFIYLLANAPGFYQAPTEATLIVSVLSFAFGFVQSSSASKLDNKPGFDLYDMLLPFNLFSAVYWASGLAGLFWAWSTIGQYEMASFWWWLAGGVAGCGLVAMSQTSPRWKVRIDETASNLNISALIYACLLVLGSWRFGWHHEYPKFLVYMLLALTVSSYFIWIFDWKVVKNPLPKIIIQSRTIH